MHIDNLEDALELRDQRGRLLAARRRIEGGSSIDIMIANLKQHEIKIVHDEQNLLRDAVLARINERLDEVEHELADYGVILAGAKEADDAL